MNRRIAVSLENGSVRVVYGDVRKGSVAIEKSLIFSDAEFDRYLETTNDDEFIVVNDFQNIYQDLISIPPAEDKYLRALVELEIRKRLPELKNFSFFFEVLRDVQREGRRTKDIFFFAVTDEEIENVLDRFISRDKTVSYLYPNVLPLARFIHIAGEEEGQPLLGVVDMGMNKTMFLTVGNRLNFVRVAQSYQKGVSDLDVDNVNMTIAYCRQVLRLNPSKVVYLGSEPEASVGATVVPTAKAVFGENVLAFAETLRENVVPVASILYARELRESSLLPERYRGLHVQRKVMAYAVLFLLLFSVLGIGYGALKFTDLMLTKSEIVKVRREIAARQGIIEDYEKTTEEFTKLEPLIRFIQTANRFPDTQKALASLQAFSMDGIRVASIDVRDDGEGMVLQIEGAIGAATYKELQGRYEHLLATVKEIKGFEIVSQGLELKDKRFRVDVRWKT